MKFGLHKIKKNVDNYKNDEIITMSHLKRTDTAIRRL